MLHACFYTICLLFRYTSWHFYAFSGTNLLTSCHSASFLFSAVFVFQKWYTRNILGIGRNKFLKSYFVRELPEIRRGVGGGLQGHHTPGWHGLGLGRATLVCGALVAPLQLLFGSLEDSGKNKTSGTCFVQFWEYFLCITSETQKQQKTGNWHCGTSLIG